MNWSPQQDAALTAVHQWLENGSEQVFRLFGYAGTGKTTLARHFAEGVSGRVLFGAFTGKAAYVLQSKGCIGATTIHKLIYIPSSRSKARLMELEDALRLLEAQPAPEDSVQAANHLANIHWHKEEIEAEKENVNRPMFKLNLESVVRDARLLIIDECSMVDQIIGEDLLSFGTKILVLGDPAQLPPVKGAGFFTECKPEIMLTEIHRQAKDNPIISLATTVREGGIPSLGRYGESVIIPRSEFNREHVLAADQVIVGRNQTRHDFNDRFREILGRKQKLPESGDKLVCLRNNHDLGILNGGIWYVQDELGTTDDRVILRIKDEIDGFVTEVEAHSKIFLREEIPWWDKKDAEEFDYGYALTCHKAQGSQWNHVLVFDESASFRQNRVQWLYTAITRAAERVVVVL